jgi:hypothetical protein
VPVTMLLMLQVLNAFSRMGASVLTWVPPPRAGHFSDTALLQRVVQRPASSLDAFARGASELGTGVITGVTGLVLDPMQVIIVAPGGGAAIRVSGCRLFQGTDAAELGAGVVTGGTGRVLDPMQLMTDARLGSGIEGSGSPWRWAAFEASTAKLTNNFKLHPSAGVQPGRRAAAGGGRGQGLCGRAAAAGAGRVRAVQQGGVRAVAGVPGEAGHSGHGAAAGAAARRRAPARRDGAAGHGAPPMLPQYW